MPGYNGKGPNGFGPMTGRGLGPCGCGFKRGFGRGFGRGLGYRFAESDALTEIDEKKILESNLKELEAEKEAIKKKLKELK
ncbi:MAG: DUF5320 domain-containing protein [archaeon]|jgi:hypothetical protein